MHGLESDLTIHLHITQITSTNRWNSIRITNERYTKETGGDDNPKLSTNKIVAGTFASQHILDRYWFGRTSDHDTALPGEPK